MTIDLNQYKITTFVVYQKDLTNPDSFPLGKNSEMFDIFRAARMTNQFMLIMSPEINHFCILGDIDDEVRMLLALTFQELNQIPSLMIASVHAATVNWPDITDRWNSAEVVDNQHINYSTHIASLNRAHSYLNCHYLNYYFGIFSMNFV